MRAAVYTAIYGPYDRPKPTFNIGGRAVLYTDNRYIEAPGWEVRYNPLDHIETPMLRAKYWKTHPIEALPEVDVSVWIDGSLLPGPRFLSHCLEGLLADDISFTPHPLRDCIYDEANASYPLPKYNADRMRAQIDYYRRSGHPAHWGLFATGAMTRRHFRRVREVMDEWWLENIEWSWQDQLSLPVVMRRHPEVSWNTNMPWALHWGYVEHGTGL